MTQTTYDLKVVYTIDQLREIIIPIAKSFGMSSVGLFGSYARGEADEESDVDLIMDPGSQRITRIFGVGGEVEEATGKNVDVYAWQELLPGAFQDSIRREAIML